MMSFLFYYFLPLEWIFDSQYKFLDLGGIASRVYIEILCFQVAQ